jgi:DNA recombination protein RmuC
MEILFLVIGIVIGILLAFFILKNIFGKKNIESEKEIILLKENLLQLKNSIEESKLQIANKDQIILDTTSQLSEKKSDLNHLKIKLAEQKEEVRKLQDQFRIEFKNLANEILENNSKKFTEDNKSKLDQLLKPLGEKIKDFEKKVEETYDKESKLRFSLKEEIKRLGELNQQVSKDTENLTRALKGESKTQGNWGEVILESILEKSGLHKNREYYVQSSYKDEHGNRLQPDIVITYPGKRNVVIDSKVSLTAYDRYISSDNEDEKETAFKAHIVSIKNHINELSSKNYQDLYQLNSLDFVMMFLPVEPAYLLAIGKDPDLWHYAYTKRILIISPTNLIAALKMIESLWRQENQTKNVQEIARQVGTLYDKFVGFVEDLLKIGNKLKDTQNIYEESMKKLSTGKGNLVKKVEDIKSLGIKTAKELSKKVLDSAEEE